MVLQYHPEKQGQEKKFIELTEAYEVLSDPKRREAYDRWLVQSKVSSMGHFSATPAETSTQNLDLEITQKIKALIHLESIFYNSSIVGMVIHLPMGIANCELEKNAFLLRNAGIIIEIETESALIHPKLKIKSESLESLDLKLSTINVSKENPSFPKTSPKNLELEISQKIKTLIHLQSTFYNCSIVGMVIHLPMGISNSEHKKYASLLRDAGIAIKVEAESGFISPKLKIKGETLESLDCKLGRIQENQEKFLALNQ